MSVKTYLVGVFKLPRVTYKYMGNGKVVYRLLWPIRSSI